MLTVVVFDIICLHPCNRSVSVSAPLDVSPLFVLAGSVIPVGDPHIMSLNNATDSRVVTWQKLQVSMRTYTHITVHYYVQYVFFVRMSTIQYTVYVSTIDCTM